MKLRTSLIACSNSSRIIFETTLKYSPLKYLLGWPKNNCVFLCTNKERIFHEEQQLYQYINHFVRSPSFRKFRDSESFVEKSSHSFEPRFDILSLILAVKFCKPLVIRHIRQIIFHVHAHRLFLSFSGAVQQKMSSFDFPFWKRKQIIVRRIICFSKTSLNNQPSNYAMNLKL